MFEEYVRDPLFDSDTRSLIEKHREDIELRLQLNFKCFEVLGISTTVSAGINHEILIKSENGKIINLYIYESPNHCRQHTNLCNAILINHFN